MNFNEIKELISIIDKSTLSELEVKNSTIYIKMSKNKIQQQEKVVVKEIAQTIQNDFVEELAAPTITIQEEVKSEPTQTKGNIVKSPIVGTFYSTPNPEKPAYVKVGDKVKKGQTLCIIEAMKVMNEIVSPYDGVVEQIFIKNEQMVEFDQELLSIL